SDEFDQRPNPASRADAAIKGEKSHACLPIPIDLLAALAFSIITLDRPMPNAVGHDAADTTSWWSICQASWSVAILEAARFALVGHFLCPKELLPCQAFCHDVPVFGRQLGVPVIRYRRGEIEPHMGAYAVLGYASPSWYITPRLNCASKLRCSAAIRYHFNA